MTKKKFKTQGQIIREYQHKADLLDQKHQREEITQLQHMKKRAALERSLAKKLNVW